jgi:hypothetical protein
MKLIFVIALVTANLAPLNNNSINLNFNSSSNQSANQDSNLLSLNSTIPQGSWGMSLKDKQKNTELPLIHAKDIISVPVRPAINVEDGFYEENKFKIYTSDLKNIEVHFDFTYGANDLNLINSSEKNIFLEVESNVFFGEFVDKLLIVKSNSSKFFTNRTEGSRKIRVLPQDQTSLNEKVYLNLVDLIDPKKVKNGIIKLKFNLGNIKTGVSSQRIESFEVVIITDSSDPKLVVAPFSLFRSTIEKSYGNGKDFWWWWNETIEAVGSVTNQKPTSLNASIKDYIPKVEKIQNVKIFNDQTNLAFNLPDSREFLVVSAIDEFGVGEQKNYRPVKSYSCVVKSNNNNPCSTTNYSPLFANFSDRNKAFFKITEAGVYEFRIEEYSGLVKTYVINYARDVFNIAVQDSGQKPIANNSATNSSVFLSYASPYLTEISVNGIKQTTNDSSFTRTISEDGRYVIEAQNFAGQKAQFNSNANFISFIIDKKAPTIELFGVTPKSNDIYNVPVSLRFRDELSGVNRVEVTSLLPEIINTNTSTINLTNDNTYTIEVFDGAGNKTSRIIKIDRTIPVINSIEQFNNKDVEISVSDANFSRIEYKEEKASSFTTTLNQTLTLKEEGKYEINVLDQADNKNTTSFIIDKTAPKINETISSALVQKLKLTFSDNLSGIKSLFIKKDDGEYRSLGELSEYEFDVVGKYEIYLEDKAGNKSVTYNFEINNELPFILGAVNGAFYNNPVNLNFVSDKSTVTKAELSIDNSQFTSLSNLSTYSATVNGKYKIKVTNAQNNVQEINFVVDNEIPTISGVVNNEYTNRTNPILFSDAVSGISSVQVILPNNKVQDLGSSLLFTPTDEGKYELTVKDKSGNTNKVIFYIDRTAPKIIGVTNNSVYKESVTLDIVENINIESANLTSYTSTYAGNIPNRYVYENEGSYKIEVSDSAGNLTTVNFVIDKTPPVIANVENGKVYSENKSVSITDPLTGIDEVRLTINGAVENVTLNPLGLVTLTKSGTYNLTAVDKAGNSTSEIIFTIDNVKPEILDKNKKIVNGESFSSVVIEVKDNLKLAQVKVNGRELVNQNFEFIIPMKYKIEAKDEANNLTVLEFEIKEQSTQVRALTWLRFDNKNFYAESNVMAYLMSEPKYEYSLIESSLSNITQILGFSVLDASSIQNQASSNVFYSYKINNLKLASSNLDVLKKHMLSEIRKAALNRNYFDNAAENVFRNSSIEYDEYDLSRYGELFVTVKDPATNDTLENVGTILGVGSYIIELKDSYGFEQFINVDVIASEKNTESVLSLISGSDKQNGLEAKNKLSFSGSVRFDATIGDPQALIKFTNKDATSKNISVDELNKLVIQESGLYKFAVAFYDYTLNKLVSNEFEIALIVETLKVTSLKDQRSLKYDLVIDKPGVAYDIFNIEISKDGQDLSVDDAGIIIGKDNLNYRFNKRGDYIVTVFYNNTLQTVHQFKVEFDKLSYELVDRDNQPIPFSGKSSNRETRIVIKDISLSNLTISVTENGQAISTPSNLSFVGKDNALTKYSVKVTDRFVNNIINEEINFTIDRIMPTLSYKFVGTSDVNALDSVNNFDGDIELISNKQGSRIFIKKLPENIELTNLKIQQDLLPKSLVIGVIDESDNEVEYRIEFSAKTSTTGDNNLIFILFGSFVGIGLVIAGILFYLKKRKLG